MFSRVGLASGEHKVRVCMRRCLMFGTLVPWRTRFPVTFGRMERDMEDLMDRLFRNEDLWWKVPEMEFVPRVDIAETEKMYEVTMDLPGIDPKHVTVEIRK